MRSSSQLTLQKLEVLCAVVELKSVTRAAVQLHVSQPVVTAHLRGIEDKLGVTLFHRQGRGLVLTEAGVHVHKWALGIVTRTRELDRALAGSGEGGMGRALLAVSMSAGSYLLPPVLCDFHRQHPEGKVQVMIATTQVALESVRSGASDFAVVMLLPDLDLEGLSAVPLWDEPLLLVSAPASRWVGEAADRDTLSKIPFIGTFSAIMQQLEEGQVRANGIAPRQIIMEQGHPEAQKAAVRCDLGVAFFLQSAVRAEIDRGDLRSVATPGLKLGIPLYLVCRVDKELSSYQRSLMAFIRSARPAGVAAFAS